jgi:nucleotide-binding universal stress UspA family protein
MRCASAENTPDVGTRNAPDTVRKPATCRNESVADENQQELENSGEEIRAILVAVDSSTSAARVIATAARLARAVPAATLHVVHVFRASRLDHARTFVPETSAGFVEDAKEQLRAHVRAARRQCRNQVVDHFVIGEPVPELLALSRKLSIDLLVIGTHDHKGFERLLLGSIAETLMRKVGCSVLVVRPTAHS